MTVSKASDIPPRNSRTKVAKTCLHFPNAPATSIRFRTGFTKISRCRLLSSPRSVTFLHGHTKKSNANISFSVFESAGLKSNHTKEKEIMAEKTAQSNVTTDHDTIRKWVEERDGKPARVKGTGNKGKEDESRTGLLRIDFPGGEEEKMETIEWEEFFREFEENNLAFLYQEETKDGGDSRFNKFIDRNSV